MVLFLKKIFRLSWNRVWPLFPQEMEMEMETEMETETEMEMEMVVLDSSPISRLIRMVIHRRWEGSQRVQ
jgi:hypothetical protein